jgi:hypothetical protein
MAFSWCGFLVSSGDQSDLWCSTRGNPIAFTADRLLPRILPPGVEAVGVTNVTGLALTEIRWTR